MRLNDGTQHFFPGNVPISEEIPSTVCTMLFLLTLNSKVSGYNVREALNFDLSSHPQQTLVFQQASFTILDNDEHQTDLF